MEMRSVGKLVDVGNSWQLAIWPWALPRLGRDELSAELAFIQPVANVYSILLSGLSEPSAG